MAKPANSTVLVQVVGRYHISPTPNSDSGSGSAALTCLPLTFFDIPWLLLSGGSPSQPLFFYQYPYPTCHFLSTTLPALTHSLSLTLQHFFALAGTLVLPLPPPDSDDSSAPPHPPRIVYHQGNYISLVVAESKGGDFFHLSGNHQRSVHDFYPLLPQLPSIAVAVAAAAAAASASASKEMEMEMKIPLVSAQITIFSNSGICIGFSYHNVVADGRTFNSFIKTWASLFRDPINPLPLPFYDRTVIKDTDGLHSTFLNELWSNRNKYFSNSQEMNNLCESESHKVRATFVMRPWDMEKLKQWIVGECKMKKKPQPPLLTPSNLTCAFVWVCLIKAEEKQKVNDGKGKLSLSNGNKNGKSKKASYFGFNAGGIGRLEYGVPSTYFGNCIGFARAMAIESALCGEDGIIVAATAIGNKVKELDEASVLKGAESWISDWEVFYGYGNGDGDDVNVMVAGSPKLDFYETDFGWGRPNKIEEISIDNNANAISFTESRDVKGGIEVGLALSLPKMEAFTTLFTQALNDLISISI